MPADVSAQDLPDPSDSAVRTRRVPAETAAAVAVLRALVAQHV